MNFFLLKWVFNAIKRESAEDDPKFKGQSYIAKTDLVKQLSKNPELMRALGYDDQRQLAEAIRVGAGKKEGYLTWGEFLDFFFLGNTSLQDKIDGNDWWNQLDSKGNYICKNKVASSKDENAEDHDHENQDASNLQGSPGAANMRSPSQTRKSIKMTPSIKML